jgi:hypothetical protein
MDFRAAFLFRDERVLERWMDLNYILFFYLGNNNNIYKSKILLEGVQLKGNLSTNQELPVHIERTNFQKYCCLKCFKRIRRLFIFVMFTVLR